MNTNEFETNKTLRISPPDGEFTVMNYRISGDYAAPFKIYPFVEELSASKVELTIKLKACFDKDIFASYANVKVPIPKSSANAYPEVQKNQNERVTIPIETLRPSTTRTRTRWTGSSRSSKEATRRRSR